IVGEGGSGETLHYTLAAPPAHGIANVKDHGDWSYYPDDTYTGEDRFAVIVKDENGAAGVSIVQVEVLHSPKPPVLETVIQPTDKKTQVSGNVTVIEANGNTLTFSVDQDPQHGQVVMNEKGQWTYTPNVDYVGDDRFMARVTNEHGQSATAIVRTYVAPTA